MEETGTSALSPGKTTTPRSILGDIDPETNSQAKPAGDELETSVTGREIDKSDTSAIRCGEQQEQSICQATQQRHQRPWVQYSEEFMDPRTDEIIYKRTSRTPTFEESFNSGSADEPIFERVTTYKARLSSDKESPTSKPHANYSEEPPRALGSAISYRILIYSRALINALQAVVAYYPSQNLSGDVLEIDWPYRILVHHYDELVLFQNKVMSKSPADLCVRERDAAEHLKLLIQFLDDAVMVDIWAEAERNKRGFCTYENFWYLYRPGCVVVSNLISRDRSDWDAMVVEEASGGPSGDSGRWDVRGWNLRFDGTYLDRQRTIFAKASFTGETTFSSNVRFIYDSTSLEDEEAQRKIAYGKRYWELIQKQCQHHRGKSCDFPYNEVSSTIYSTPCNVV